MPHAQERDQLVCRNPHPGGSNDFRIRGTCNQSPGKGSIALRERAQAALGLVATVLTAREKSATVLTTASSMNPRHGSCCLSLGRLDPQADEALGGSTYRSAVARDQAFGIVMQNLDCCERVR